MTQFLEQQMGRELNLDFILALEKQIELEGDDRALIQLKRVRNSLLNVSILPPTRNPRERFSLERHSRGRL
jgi:hypothetical protein